MKVQIELRLRVATRPLDIGTDCCERRLVVNEEFYLWNPVSDRTDAHIACTDCMEAWLASEVASF